MKIPKQSCCALVGLCFTSGCITKQSTTNQKLKITALSDLVDYVLHSVDDALLPTVDGVLGLINLKDEIEETIGLKHSTPDITPFQKELD